MKTMTKALIVAGTIGAVSAIGMTGIAFADRAGGYHGMGSHHGMGMRHGKDGRWAHMGRKGGHHGFRAARFMETYDTDNDGKVTKEELETVRKDKLAKFDADNDGQLSLDEYQALWVDAMRERIVRSFQRFDSDGDAKVTGEEYQTPMDRMFRRLDRNDDGALSRDDRRRHGWNKRDGERRDWRGRDRRESDDRDDDRKDSEGGDNT
jgi:Ca2+-binding EF-hand superfamily protein